MADETLTWTLDFDVKTGEIKSSNQTLQQLVDLIGKTRKGTGDLERGFSSMTRAGIQIASLKSIFDGLRATIGAAAGALNQFGDFAVKSFGERSSTLRAYTTLLGSAVKAEVEFSKAQQLALRTDLTSASIEKSQKALMVAGFRGGALDRAMLATADLASMAAPEERDQVSERVSRGLSQILAKGKLSGEELMQLSEAGIGRSYVNAELRKLGVTGDIDKAISGGKVSAEVGINAIERAVMAQLGTSRLGEFATGSTGSVTSLMSNRDEAVQNLLKSVDSESLPGMQRFRESLIGLNEALSLDSESGKNLSLVLQDGASTITGLKATMQDFMAGFVASFGESYMNTLKELGITSEESDKKLGEMGASAKGLGDIMGRVGSAVALLSKGLESITPVMDAIGSAISWVGKVVTGVIDEIARVSVGLSMLARGDYKGMVEYLNQTKERPDVGGAPARAAAAGESLIADLYDQGGGAGTGGGPGVYNPLGMQFKEWGKFGKKGARAARSGGGGGGGGAYADWDWSPDWTGGDGWGGARASLGAAVGGQIDAIRKQDYHVTISGDVRIEVHGSQDPGAVADAVMDRFMRKVGRMVRTPSARTQ